MVGITNVEESMDVADMVNLRGHGRKSNSEPTTSFQVAIGRTAGKVATIRTRTPDLVLQIVPLLRRDAILHHSSNGFDRRE